MRRTILASAVVALLIAGGSATAAHLITSRQIANGTIANRDVARGTISLNRLSPGVQKLLRESASANRTSSNSQNSASSGAAGPKGDTGPAGAKGDAGPGGAKGDKGADADAARVVTSDSLQGFTLAPKGDSGDTSDNGTVGFGTPPSPALGSKALELTSTTGKTVAVYAPLPSGSQRPLIGELTKASYGSLVASEPQSALDVSLQIEVTGSEAPHFSSGYTTVVFEPYQNGSPDETGKWHRHSVDTGKVWSTQGLPSGHCTQGAPCPFSTFVAENPKAVVQSVKFRIGQNSGAGWAGFHGFVDDLSLGFGPVTRYDFGG